jgi:predicted enzyme related to lactoylglutathione lyase
MSDSFNLGRIAWYQLVTSDTASAQNFYAKVVGWDGKDGAGDTDSDSAWSQLQRYPALVTMDEDDGLTPHWRVYISVPNADSACQRTIMGGGEVLLETTQLDGIGKVAVLGDENGAIFAVVETSESLPGYPDGDTQDGQFCWSELGTKNYAQAFRFYESIFHWSPGRAVNVPNGRVYQMFKHGDREIGGMMDLIADSDVPPHWMHYIRVASVDEAVSAAQSNGGSVVIAPHDVPDGARTACITDPQGAVFSVWSPKVGKSG